MILVNGKLVNEDVIFIDNSFWYGKGVFETMLVTNKPIFLDRHINRLNKSLKEIGINKNINEDLVLEAVQKLNSHNCVLKLSVSNENIVFSTRPNQYDEKSYKKGAKLKIFERVKNSNSPTIHLKALNNLDNTLMHNDAVTHGFSNALFTNENDHITECDFSNVFFIHGNRISTPHLKCGLLPGIIREWITETVGIFEGEYNIEHALSCDSAFITNSVMGIMPVSKIGTKLFSSHEIIRKLDEKYKSST